MKKKASSTKQIILDKSLDSIIEEEKMNESLQNSHVNNDEVSSRKGEEENQQEKSTSINSPKLSETNINAHTSAKSKKLKGNKRNKKKKKIVNDTNQNEEISSRRNVRTSQAAKRKTMDDQNSARIQARNDAKRKYNQNKLKRVSKIKNNTPLEERRSEAELRWNEMVNYDYQFQRKAKGIEYVDVKNCSNLNEKSLAYLEEFRSMNKEEKIEMLEIDNYDSDEDRDLLKDENHFLLHSDDSNCEVIHKAWFKLDQDEWQNEDKRRIKKSTISKCYDKPNEIHPLEKKEIKWIKRACDIMTKTSQITKIKRLPDNYKDMTYYEIIFEGKVIRTKVKYVGIDTQNKSCPLEDQWLKDNFNKRIYGSMWQKIVDLKPNHNLKLNVGSSGNDPEKIKIPENEKGPSIKYQQKEGQMCLILSLLNVMHYLGKDIIVKKLLEKNNMIIKNSLDCSMNEILDLMTNKGLNKGEKRIKNCMSRE